jgi:ribosomal-protein-alanine N-acetyltransferase
VGPLATRRLVLRRFVEDDAPFVRSLVNEPSWVRFIGDRGVRTVDDARAYLTNGPIAMYARHGFGLYLVALEDGTPIGMCGILKRDTLEDVDIGFALLPAYWGQGYAREAAEAVLVHAHQDFGLTRIVAITSLDNDPSIALLGKLGFQFERTIVLSGEELKLFAWSPPCALSH